MIIGFESNATAGRRDKRLTTDFAIIARAVSDFTTGIQIIVLSFVRILIYALGHN
jgi:hypothetical protein